MVWFWWLIPVIAVVYLLKRFGNRPSSSQSSTPRHNSNDSDTSLNPEERYKRKYNTDLGDDWFQDYFRSIIIEAGIKEKGLDAELIAVDRLWQETFNIIIFLGHLRPDTTEEVAEFWSSFDNFIRKFHNKLVPHIAFVCGRYPTFANELEAFLTSQGVRALLGLMIASGDTYYKSAIQKKIENNIENVFRSYAKDSGLKLDDTIDELITVVEKARADGDDIAIAGSYVFLSGLLEAMKNVPDTLKWNFGKIVLKVLAGKKSNH